MQPVLAMPNLQPPVLEDQGTAQKQEGEQESDGARPVLCHSALTLRHLPPDKEGLRDSHLLQVQNLGGWAAVALPAGAEAGAYCNDQCRQATALQPRTGWLPFHFCPRLCAHCLEPWGGQKWLEAGPGPRNCPGSCAKQLEWVVAPGALVSSSRLQTRLTATFTSFFRQALCQEHPQQFPTTTKVKMKGRRLRVEAEEAGGPPGLAGCLGHGLG
ncbi:hypothetical protein P7K49_028495 [Saguinus oedipus]|uniref:Uncharacterized protein n=1 Tax=Saguinus oedipus TaxID=9490 RepID=A0ABQ9U4H0_SAGOE|nr:hypothetical protein P7K49_028495 [Saguinus oedipus]